MNRLIDRRDLLRGGAFAGGVLATSGWLPAWAQSLSNGLAAPVPIVSGSRYHPANRAPDDDH